METAYVQVERQSFRGASVMDFNRSRRCGQWAAWIEVSAWTADREWRTKDRHSTQWNDRIVLCFCFRTI